MTDTGSLLEGAVPWPAAFAERYRAEGLWTGETLDGMLRRNAAADPDRTALVCGERRLTHAELDARVDSLACGLRQRLRPLDRIVVQLPNRMELVELLFACFRASVIPVMALPGHRRVDLEHFVRQTDARALATVGRWAGFDHAGLARVLRGDLESLEHLFVVSEEGGDGFDSLRAGGAGLPPADATQVALLQLSGGSTGTPKLIPRTHDDYLFSVRRSAELCGLGPSSVYLVALPGTHNFPLSSAGILGALWAGGTVVLCPRPDPSTAFGLIDREGVTITGVVPPLARAWLAAAPAGGLSSLEVLQVGGAKLDPELATELVEGFGCTLQQVFGMAEGLVCYTRLGDSPGVVLETQGRPMCEADELRVVDANGDPVPDGEVGDLQTRGPYTIRGYYRAPEHDRSAFTADGFYRTGDRVRLRPDGNLVVEGRSKEQVSRGGEKIAPVEVEAHLRTFPGVRDAAVVGVPDRVLGERLCAVLVVEGEPQIRRPALVRHLRDRGVAEFKMPDRIAFVDALPTTKVGKTDRRALERQLRHPATGGTP